VDGDQAAVAVHRTGEDPQPVTRVAQPAGEALGEGVSVVTGEAGLGPGRVVEGHEGRRRHFFGHRDGLHQQLLAVVEGHGVGDVLQAQFSLQGRGRVQRDLDR
jgi:hypothetical protein